MSIITISGLVPTPKSYINDLSETEMSTTGAGIDFDFDSDNDINVGVIFAAEDDINFDDFEVEDDIDVD
ncbi:MAG: hypothetical protein AAF383_21940 [Cyanobacteria bacterium P01_A01_bin.83]